MQRRWKRSARRLGPSNSLAPELRFAADVPFSAIELTSCIVGLCAEPLDLRDGFFVDDLRLQTVPEPTAATLLLLGKTGLVASARRLR